jgi:hypothetical protein
MRVKWGLFRPVVIVEANVGFGGTGMFGARQPVSRFQFSNRLFSGIAAERRQAEFDFTQTVRKTFENITVCADIVYWDFATWEWG